MILRTGTFNPCSVRRRSTARPGTVETSCWNVAANPRRFLRRWGLDPFYPSGGHKPMVGLAISIGTANAVPAFLRDGTVPLAPVALQPLERLLASTARHSSRTHDRS